MWVKEENFSLVVDLYELTMADSYLRRGMTQNAVFDLFVRELPDNRSFLVAAGLEDALSILENMRFRGDDVAYLRGLGIFSDAFLDWLGGFRFSGDVLAMPEGSVFFPPEPVLTVRAPLPEAQIAETVLLNTINFQTMVASKAARVVTAARGRPVVDFSPRRDHGPQAALWAARASYLAGCAGTSHVLAGKIYGIPVFGTMAHSFIMAFGDETEAFVAFARDFPDNATLLVDTYDTLEGTKRAVEAQKILKNVSLKGIRIDSGDLASLADEARKILDNAGLEDVKIFLSGDLNEFKIEDILRETSSPDAFGVGTDMGTSRDAPALGGVYKLVELGGEPKVKLSEDKATLPGRKQVFRVYESGHMAGDTLGLEDEDLPGERLLVPVMKEGKRLREESLRQIRERVKAGLARLPRELTNLRGQGTYPVATSPGIRRLLEDAVSALGEKS